MKIRVYYCYDDRVVGGAVEYGVSYGADVRRLRRQYCDVHRVRAVGVPDCRHSATDGRTVRFSAHTPASLVRQSPFATSN